MGRKKYFIIEADDAEPPQRYLSGGLEFTTNRQIALRFDLLDSARDFIKNNFNDDDCSCRTGGAAIILIKMEYALIGVFLFCLFIIP